MRIVIVGGGIGGLAAGIALRRMGINAHVYEAANPIREIRAGVTLWPNAIRALDWLGIGNPVREAAFGQSQASLRTPEGKLLLTLDYERLARKFGESVVGIHRSDLRRILVRGFPRHALHLGATFTGFETTSHGIVAHLASGKEIRADAVVGADGVRSPMRSRLSGRNPLKYAGYTAWQGATDFNHLLADPGATWGRGMRFVRVPLSRGRVHWMATLNCKQGERSPGGEKAELLRLFKDWHDPIPSLIAATPRTKIHRADAFFLDPLPTWGDGPATLLGDAAHPITPDLGMGICQVLEDVVVLAQSFKGNRDPASVFRKYEQARMPRTAAVSRMARRVARIGQREMSMAVMLRNWLVARIPGGTHLQPIEKILEGDPLL